jgi:uncharacterized protein (DUF2062 family)
MKKIIIAEFIVLLLGVVFAWGNFIYELVNWLNDKNCATGCSVSSVTNPFLTPCFFGALFFSAAFVLSAILLKKTSAPRVN